MDPRDKFIAALEKKEIRGLVPHFELVFFLTMEAFGKVHPSHRYYHQWDQMSKKEQQLHREDIAEIYIKTAEMFEHSAIYLQSNPRTDDEMMRLTDIVRDKTGNRFFLMTGGDATYSIPDGTSMHDFSYQLVDNPLKLKDDAEKMVDTTLERAEKFAVHRGLDGFALCSDYCFNNGPFLSPCQFSEFIAPYLARLIKGYRDLNYYTIKHTDGNIMPILDQLIQTNPHALHSLDPQGGVDIAEVKKIAGKKVCLIGNVNCGLLQNGTQNEVIESARYALKNGMPGGGYIFSTSNCIYTGMPIERYKLMLSVWKNEGLYK